MCNSYNKLDKLLKFIFIPQTKTDGENFWFENVA